MLERYAELKTQQAEIEKELAEIEKELADWAKSGPVALCGWIARWKPGRKSTNHEAAFNAKMEECVEHQMHGIGSQLNELKEKFSTTKVTVAWAKVTAAAKIDVEPFTTEGESVFVIEKAK